MTREEEIENMATYYAELVDKEYGISPLRKRIVKNAYWAGANWADEHPNLESLWHDISEEPKDGKRIIIHFGEDNCGIYTRSGKSENEWCNWCKVVHALRWAYIDDLLPKGGER